MEPNAHIAKPLAAAGVIPAETTKEKLDQVYHAVYGERVGETREIGLIVRVRRIEAAARIVLLGVGFDALHSAGVPTERLIDFVRNVFEVILTLLAQPHWFQ